MRKITSKLIVSVLVLAGLPVAHGQSAFFQAVTNLNPAGYWPLQEAVAPPAAHIEPNLGSLGAVANAYYSSTNVVPGGPVTVASDPGAASVSFKGLPSGVAGAFLAVPMADHRVAVPVGAFSVEAWVYPTNINANANTIISQTGGPSGSGGLNGSPNAAGWSLNQNYIPSINQNGLAGFSFHVFNGNGPFGGAEAVTIVQSGTSWGNQWYHIVGVFDGTNASLYVDAVLESTNNGYQVPISGSYVQDTWSPLTIGCGRGFNNNAYYGYMAEVAVYTYALSGTQISTHYGQFGSSTYTNTILADSPYMYWRMNAPTVASPALSAYPAAANFGSANGGGLYLSGTTPGVAGPPYAGLSPSLACAFNGIGTDFTNTSAIYTNGVLSRTNVQFNSGITITNLTTALTITNTNISALVWFKANPADNRFQGLIGHSDSSWRLAFDGTVGKVHWNQGAGAEITSARTYNDGQWHLAVGVYTNITNTGTNATGTNYLYVDGLLDTAIPANGNTVGSLTNILLGGAPDYTLTGGGGYNQRFFAGSLAHAAYFTSALSAPQIQALYSAAEPPPGILALAPSTVNYAGATNTLTVTANGASTLAYQWYYNSSSNYSGATKESDGGRVSGSQTASLTTANLQNSDAGYYFVVVTNNYGSVTSLLSQLTINPNDPVITAQVPGGPFSLFVGQGSTLSVTAAGSTPLIYQWYTNGVADTTAGTGSSYAVTNAQLAMSGFTYQCIVANTIGSATGALSTLSVVNLTNAYSQAIVALHPNAYWPMHEVAAPSPGDIETNLGSLGALGNAYYGDWAAVNAGLIAHQTPGALANDPDTAATFGGSAGSYLVVPHFSPLSTIRVPFTVEAWIKPYNSKSYSVIVGQGGSTGLNGSSSLGGFALQWSGTPNSFSTVIWNGVGSGNYEQKTVTTYPAAQWYHVVSTYDGTNVAYWINGQLAQFGTLQSSNAGSLPGYMHPDTWSPLVIGGGRWNGSGASQLFSGQIDEVAIYTNILSQQRISTHYSDGTSGASGAYKGDVLADNPLFYYRMDAPAYTLPARSTWPVLHNYGLNGPNGVYSPGTLVGAAAGPSESGIPMAGLPAGAMVTQGNSMGSFADAGIDPTWNPVNFTTFSFSAWFRGIPADGRTFQGIMSGNDATWRCSINGSNGKVQTHGGSSDISSPLAYNDGNWHHMVTTSMVFTNNGNITNLQSLYVDGALVITNISGTTNNPLNGQPFPEVFLGNECNETNNPVGPGRSFAGSVCEAAFFYGTALTSNQVQALYVAAGVPPFILTQPVSATVNERSAFTNSVGANGGPTLTYQWYKNNQSLPLAGQTNLPFGATNSFLVINPVQTSDASTNYYVVVTNPYGAVQSATWSLAENTTAVITNQLPVPYTNLFSLFAGVSPTYSVGAGGATPISYRWYTNGVLVGGATNSSVTLSNVQVGSLANYCVVSNFLGTATSVVWNAQVLATPTAPYAQAVLALHPISYWRLNEADDGLSDGNPGAIALDYANGEDGIYTNTALSQLPGYNNNVSDPETCAEFGHYATANCYAAPIQGIDFASPSNSATFTVEAWVNGVGEAGLNTPGIASKGYYFGEEFALDCGAASQAYRFEIRSANGTAYNANSTNLANDFKWHHLVGVCDEVHSNVLLYVDGIVAGSTPITPGSGIIFGSNSPVYIGARPQSPTSGANQQFYGFINDVAIFNYALSANQVLNEYLAAGIGPTFTLQPPASTNVSEGATLVIPTAVVGTAPIAYQWSDTLGLPIFASQTNATLIISNLPASLNGDSVTLTASNPYGTNTSVSCSITVQSGPPVIQSDIQPTNLTVLAGANASFTVDVTGTYPLSYFWLYNGNPLSNGGRFSGVNGNTLTINDVQFSDSGIYQLFITNVYGTNYSSAATLTVTPVLGFNGNGAGWYSQTTVSAALAWLGNNGLQLTADLGNSDSAAFYSSPIYVGAFQASFTYQVPTGPSGSADGTTFCIQTDPRGVAAIGGGGGQLGVGTSTPITPSVEFEFNIYAGNTVGGVGVGVSLNTDGTVGPTVSTAPVVINSGDPIDTVITYQGGTMNVLLSDPVANTQSSFTAAANIPAILGTNIAWVGFTGSDGGSKSTQTVSNFVFIPLVDLSIQQSNNTAVLRWPAASGGYSLQQNGSLFSTNWVNVTNVPAVVNAENQVIVPATKAEQFYRLRLQ